MKEMESEVCCMTRDLGLFILQPPNEMSSQECEHYFLT